jgi:uncharacterized protein (DUF1501 family)
MSCYDCNRTEMLRRAVAEAGRGLPEIEPGMPLPAGTGLSRRQFVSRAAGLALAVYGGKALSNFALDDGIAAAAANAPANQKVLVTIFMNGGIDALSVLFPAGDPAYYSLRPNLALAQSAGQPFLEDPRLRWHPSAGGLATLHGEGKVTVLPAIGYDNPNQSHFTSRHYWEVGGVDATLRTGWLGRYLDTVGTSDNPLQGLTLDVALHPSIATAKVPVATLSAADQYLFAPPGLTPHPLEASLLQEAANIGAAHAKSDDAGLKQAGQTAYDAHHLFYELGPFKYGFSSPVPYPSSSDPFPHRLAGLAAMIAAGMPVRVVGLTMGHFDTHATQAPSLSRDLQLLSDSLLAFQHDLEARGIADRVVTHVWSEFGRRPAENASAGTDHGAAGLGLLIGTKVVGQQVGNFPGLTGGGLDSLGNLRATSDFRAVYAGMLEQWLGTDANPLLPGASAFGRPTLFK